MSQPPPDPADLPDLPPGLIALIDIAGPWRVRAWVAWMLLRYAWHVLQPRSGGGKLVIFGRPAPAPEGSAAAGSTVTEWPA